MYWNKGRLKETFNLGFCSFFFLKVQSVRKSVVKHHHYEPLKHLRNSFDIRHKRCKKSILMKNSVGNHTPDVEVLKSTPTFIGPIFMTQTSDWRSLNVCLTPFVGLSWIFDNLRLTTGRTHNNFFSLLLCCNPHPLFFHTYIYLCNFEDEMK